MFLGSFFKTPLFEPVDVPAGLGLFSTGLAGSGSPYQQSLLMNPMVLSRTPPSPTLPTCAKAPCRRSWSDRITSVISQSNSLLVSDWSLPTVLTSPFLVVNYKKFIAFSECLTVILLMKSVDSKTKLKQLPAGGPIYGNYYSLSFVMSMFFWINSSSSRR